MQAWEKQGVFLQAIPLSTSTFLIFKKLSFGEIVGEVLLTSILRTEDFNIPDVEMNILTLEEKTFGDYSSGRFGWVLENPIQYKTPIRARGHLRPRHGWGIVLGRGSCGLVCRRQSGSDNAQGHLSFTLLKYISEVR